MTPRADELCRLLGVERPIIQAGMGWVTTGRLAAAVSAAGGLGVIATGGYMDGDELRGHVERVRDEAPGRPFGVNLLLAGGAPEDGVFGSRELLRGDPACVLGVRAPTRLARCRAESLHADAHLPYPRLLPDRRYPLKTPANGAFPVSVQSVAWFGGGIGGASAK